MFIDYFNNIVTVIFILCYAYQIIYFILPLLFKNKKIKVDDKPNRYAILIAARNEKLVIGNLIDSIKNQNYPSEYIDIYVCADNCNDDTAKIALNKGAYVYKRYDSSKVGKGYVLNFLLNKIKQAKKNYDAYLVFDADNILDEDFVKEINRIFNNGYDSITSYRNSKNYGDNWISAGYGLWYLHESCHLNASRMILGSSCSISGTGFLISDNLVAKNKGWNFFLLTEDIQFTVATVLENIKIGYASKAVIYDEQPTKFKQSFYQRLRWSKGYLQVFHKYGFKLVKKMLKGDFSSYDMTMNYAPAAILSIVSLLVNIIHVINVFILNKSYIYLSTGILKQLVGVYVMLFIISIITTIQEWHHIHCANIKKILYNFTFPIFMLTYLPITLIALFKKVTWKPIVHNRNIDLEEIKDN